MHIIGLPAEQQRPSTEPVYGWPCFCVFDKNGGHEAAKKAGARARDRHGDSVVARERQNEMDEKDRPPADEDGRGGLNFIASRLPRHTPARPLPRLDYYATAAAAAEEQQHRRGSSSTELNF